MSRIAAIFPSGRRMAASKGISGNYTRPSSSPGEKVNFDDKKTVLPYICFIDGCRFQYHIATLCPKADPSFKTLLAAIVEQTKEEVSNNRHAKSTTSSEEESEKESENKD